MDIDVSSDCKLFYFIEQLELVVCSKCTICCACHTETVCIIVHTIAPLELHVFSSFGPKSIKNISKQGNPLPVCPCVHAIQYASIFR